MCYCLDCKWQRPLSRGIQPPDCGTVAAFPVPQRRSSNAQCRLVVRVACCLSGEAVGILHSVCHFIANVTGETEMSTEALMEFVRECPNLYDKSRADNNDDTEGQSMVLDRSYGSISFSVSSRYIEIFASRK